MDWSRTMWIQIMAVQALVYGKYWFWAHCVYPGLGFKLLDITNNHRTLRLMLGHSAMDHESQYALQTLKDNVSLFTPEVHDRINQIFVRYGHEVIGKKPGEKSNYHHQRWWFKPIN